MRTNVFPIASCIDNNLTSLDGDCSKFYELDPIDLEQKTDTEIEALFCSIGISLDNLVDGGVVKFYHLNGKNYLNSFVELGLPLSLSPCKDPLRIYFEDSDIYSKIGFCDDYLLYNGQYRRIVSIKDFSEDESYPLFLPSFVDYVLNIKKLSNSESLKKLESVRTGHLSSLLKNKRDFVSEGAYEQAEQLLSDITHGTESLFEIELFFLLKSDSLDGLNKKTKSIINNLTTKGMVPYIEGHNVQKLKSGLMQIFSDLIPGVMPKFKHRNLPNKTGHLKYLVPINKSLLMKDGLIFHDINNGEIYFNPFSDEFKNRNMLVTGSSGGGKSVFVNKLVHSLIDDHPTVILDKGGSFKKLCLYHSGIDLKDGINPMQFKCPYYLREFILSVVDLEKFKKLEKGLLLKEIKIFLNNKYTNDFYELINYLETNFKGISLYFEDIKGFIDNNIIAPNNFLYVDIENFPKSQVAPLIIYVLEYFKSINVKEKILVFDECWSFLKDHSEFIDECFRTFRKSGSFPIAISQGLKDFEGSETNLYSSIINNSYFKVYFPQEYILGNVLSVEDNERIKELCYLKGEFSECYLKTDDNNTNKKVRIFLDELELELFNTEQSKNKVFYNFFYKNKNYFERNSDVIDSFVRLHHG